MKFYIKEIQLTDSNTWKLQGFSEGKINSIQAYYNEIREYKHPEQKLNIALLKIKIHSQLLFLLMNLLVFLYQITRLCGNSK